MGGLYVHRPATRSAVVGSGGCSRQQALPNLMVLGGALSAQSSQSVVSAPPASQAVGSVGFLSSLLVTASGQQPQLGQPGQESAGQQFQAQQQHNQAVAVAQAQAQRLAFQAPPQPRPVSDFATMTAGPAAHPGVNGLAAGMQGLALNGSIAMAQGHHHQHPVVGKAQAPLHQQQPQHPGSVNKVFVGGLSWETSDAKLRQYFENYGEVLEAFVSYDKNTGRPRGFGFVVFSSPSVADKVVSLQHTIDRREVEAKKAVPRQDMSRVHSSGGPCDASKVKKIFVGGLAPTVDEKALREYFSRYGEVDDAVVMYDPHSSRPRGFGFITFCDVASVDHVFLCGVMQELHEKQIEIKRAVPREEMAPPRRTRASQAPQPPASSGGMARLNGYNSHGAPEFNSPAYVSSLIQGQHLQQQHIWAGVPPPPVQQSNVYGLQPQQQQQQQHIAGHGFTGPSQGQPYSSLTADLAAVSSMGNLPIGTGMASAAPVPLGLNMHDDQIIDPLTHSYENSSSGGSGPHPGNFSLHSYSDGSFLGREKYGSNGLPEDLIDATYGAGQSSGLGGLGFTGIGSAGIGGAAF